MTSDHIDPTPTLMDAAITAMLDRRAGRGTSAGLRTQLLNTTVSVPQARARRLRQPLAVRWGLARVLVLALATATIVGLGLLGAGVLQRARPAPTGSATDFVRPFEYAMPVDSAMRMTEARATRSLRGRLDRISRVLSRTRRRRVPW